MEEQPDQSLTAQLLALQTRHRELDAEIARLQSFPYIDQLQLQRYKKQKLRLKDAIQRIKTQLIPDLDA